MRKFQIARMIGLHVLTPALAGLPQVAAARTVNIAQNILVEQKRTTTQEILASAVLGLSPAEKRKIAGDRIRLMRLSENKAALTDTAKCLFSVACGSVVAGCQRKSPAQIPKSNNSAPAKAHR
jgi:hypothetical protein